MLLYGEIFRGCQRHVRHEDALHGWVFGRIDEADDAVECTGIAEGVLEKEVVVVRHTHAAEDDLVRLGAQGHHGHHLIEWLIRVGEEGNLLPRHERIVQVDASDTRGDQFRRLFAAHGVHRRPADLHLAPFGYGATVHRVAIGVEETSRQLVAHLERWCLAHEHHFGVRTNALGAGEHLQCHLIAGDLHHLRQLAVH